jgi:hypothetical protein
MTHDEKLKPCPFCGEKEIHAIFNRGHKKWIYCPNCFVKINGGLKSDIIKRWNRRVK